ncbi:hypothetical protein P4646_03210 [Peribacillus simplex]|uniref:hypothetical protein n=1 Tax=Peribacillus simplex TaxID=1478 RepID=UPI002E229FDB|nr:hypothetical protein [Peribacillus simplex]MED4095355.1 hypothetical protein [Peribacillus simplex]
MKFDTIQETLDFTVESFQLEFSWDFVAIILRDDDRLYPKVWKGGSPHFADSFPIHLGECSPEILEEEIKDSYITKLFEEKIEDKAKIVEYATLMNNELY